MKFYETGSIPVHMAISEVYAEEGLKPISSYDIKCEVENCYRQFTPRQSRPFFCGDAATIEHQTKLSWDIHDEEELNEECRQSREEFADEPIIRAYMDQPSNSNANSVTQLPLVNSSRSNRRKQQKKHNRRMRNAVLVDYNGSNNRFNVDNFYTAIINRRLVTRPKSRSARYATLLKKAQKMKLITDAELAAS